MTNTEKYVTERITAWVWSGFYDTVSVREMVEDIVEADCDGSRIDAFIEAEFRRKAAAADLWPAVTDCDRLDQVFYHLHEDGICALSNTGYTMSDGYSDVAEVVANAPNNHYHGYCFYHGQDVDRAVDGDGLLIAFGDLSDDSARAVAVGRRLTAALASAGFEVSWDETVETRICLPLLEWKRRYA